MGEISEGSPPPRFMLFTKIMVAQCDKRVETLEVKRALRKRKNSKAKQQGVVRKERTQFHVGTQQWMG